jgi:hypothetical protein
VTAADACRKARADPSSRPGPGNFHRASPGERLHASTCVSTTVRTPCSREHAHALTVSAGKSAGGRCDLTPSALALARTGITREGNEPADPASRPGEERARTWICRPVRPQRLAGRPVRLQRLAGRPVRLQRLAGRPVRLQRLAGRPVRLQRLAGRPVPLRSSCPSAAGLAVPRTCSRRKPPDRAARARTAQ